MHICGLSCYVLMHEYVVQYWIQGKMNFLESLSIMVKTIKFSLFLNILYIIPPCSHSSFYYLIVTLCLLINSSSSLSAASFENPFCSQILWVPPFFWFCTSEIMQYVIILGLFHGWSSVSILLAQMMGFHSYLWLNAILLYKYAPVFVH